MSGFISLKKLPRSGSLGLAIIATLALALFVGCSQAAPTATPAAAKPAQAASAPTTPPAPAATATQPPAPTATPKPEKVSVIVDWFLDGYHTPIVVAKDKGWYAQQGLDVEIVEGKGSGNVVQMVGTKTQTFGYADPSTVVKAIAEQSVPVKVILGHLIKSPMGLAWLKTTPISKPKDLEGKKWAQTPGSAAAVMFEPFATINKIDKSKITVVNTDPTTKDAAILSGGADFADGFLGAEAARFTLAGKPGDYLLYSDYGVNSMGHSFLVHNDTIKDKPNVVRKFVAATAKGIEFTKSNPDESVDILIKYAPPQKDRRGYVLDVQKSANKLLGSANTKGKPTGWMSQLDWQETIDNLMSYGGMKKRPASEDVFTNDFLPK